MIIQEIETTSTKTNQETILNHRIEKILNFQPHKIKTIEAVPQNINDKEIKYNLHMKQIQTLQVSTIQKLRS